VARNDYLQSLGRAGLLDSERTRQWEQSAEEALLDPEGVLPPFSRSRQIREEAVEEAKAYRFELSERREVSVTTTLEGEGFLFLDLYRIDQGTREFIFSTSQGEATFTARRNRAYILRVQPEIYAEGMVNLEVRLAE
jgi:hypothetical protein